MGFINRTVEGILKLGKRAKHVANYMAPYARAALDTVVKNPEFIPQLAGLTAGAIGLGGEVAGGALTGGATALPAVATGTALMGAAKKSFGDISKAYKSELASAKGKGKKGGNLRISADDVAKLKEARAQVGKAKRILQDDNFQPNINE